jgi:hypothetical protein
MLAERFPKKLRSVEAKGLRPALGFGCFGIRDTKAKHRHTRRLLCMTELVVRAGAVPDVELYGL